MNTYLTFLLVALKEDPRVPKFQGLMINPLGRVSVVYQHGMLGFQSLEDVHLFTLSKSHSYASYMSSSSNSSHNPEPTTANAS